MPDKKLTDNLSNNSPILSNGLSDSEIVKEFETLIQCAKFVDSDYVTSPFEVKYIVSALDLINRLQAENERLKGHQKDGFFNLLGNCLVFSKTLKDYNDMRKGLKAEAYKEFAEILCEDRVSNDPVVISAKCLLKELVGDNK